MGNREWGRARLGWEIGVTLMVLGQALVKEGLIGSGKARGPLGRQVVDNENKRDNLTRKGPVKKDRAVGELVAKKGVGSDGRLRQEGGCRKQEGQSQSRNDQAVVSKKVRKTLESIMRQLARPQHERPNPSVPASKQRNFKISSLKSK